MSEYRLPSHVKPIHYDLSLSFSISKPSYCGRVLIQLEIESPSEQISLNAKDPLRIYNVRMVSPLQEDLDFSLSAFDRVDISFPSAMSGQCSLEIDFESGFLAGLDGCYSCWNPEGDQMITTQFEPISARKALPCFDEPCFKSTFKVTIEVESYFIVISNMHVLGKSETKEGFTKWEFHDTPKMSCYLLHWTICQHQKISTISKRGTEISLYANPIDYTEDFLEITKESLDFFLDYFEIDYPLPKLDIISVHQMDVRAMENWGAITFNSNVLVRYPNEPPGNFPLNCRTVCHEVSHMWFGNLVTMEWWTHLWLNEGFARFMENKCLAHIRPSLNIWDKYIPDIMNVAFLKDSSYNTHPIEVDCRDPHRIPQIFDAISYAKGASVVRMLEDAMGEAKFKEGVTKYLNMYKYENTTTEMLWEVLDSHTEMDIKQMMQEWTKTEGFPIVFARKQENKYLLTQQRHIVNSDQIWNIPIRYLTSEGEEGLFTFGEKEMVLDKDCEWIKLNYRATGVYYVLYDFEILRCLAKNMKLFSVADRYCFISQYLNHYDRKMIAYKELGLLIEGCIPEFSYIVFKLISDHLMKSVRNYNIVNFKGLIILFHRLAYPVWERFKENIYDENDYDRPALCSLAYNILIAICNDSEVEQEILRLKSQGSLPSELVPLLNFVVSESMNENIHCAARALHKIKDLEQIKEILRTHLAEIPGLCELYHRQRFNKSCASQLFCALVSIFNENEDQGLRMNILKFARSVVFFISDESFPEIITLINKNRTEHVEDFPVFRILEDIKLTVEQYFENISCDSSFSQILEFYAS